jgi:hypothetical protein
MFRELLTFGRLLRSLFLGCSSMLDIHDASFRHSIASLSSWLLHFRWNRYYNDAAHSPPSFHFCSYCIVILVVSSNNRSLRCTSSPSVQTSLVPY